MNTALAIAPERTNPSTDEINSSVAVRIGQPRRSETVAPAIAPPSAILPSSSSAQEERTGFSWFEEASVANARFAFWLKKQQESIKPKEFKQLLQELGLLRREANKYLKLAENAKDFDPEDLSGLGSMMFSLVAPKYISLWLAFKEKGNLTQELVDDLKKELFPRKKANKSEPVPEPVSVWRQQPGGGNRFCQIPPIHDQETGTKLEQIIINEGVTLQQAIKNAVKSYQPASELDSQTSSLLPSKLQSLKDEIKKVKSAIAGIDVAQPNSAQQIEKVLEQLNFLLKEESGSASASATVTLSSLAVSTADDEQALAEAELDTYLEDQVISSQQESEGLEVHEVSLESSQVPAASTDEPDILSKDKQTAVQAQLNGELEEQAIAIATSASFVVSTFEDIEGNIGGDTERTSQEEPVQSDTDKQLTEEADELLLPPPILPTERYKQGWNVGDLAIANVTYGVFPMIFRLWCECQPVRIESVSGDVGSEQRLKVTRHDGGCRSIPSTWVEEVTEPPLTLGVSSEQLEKTATLVQPTIYRVVGTGDRWEAEVVKIDERGDVNHRISPLNGGPEWTHINPQYLVAVSSEEAAMQNEAVLAEKFGFSAGEVVEWRADDFTLKGKITRLTQLGAFIDEGYPGLAWIEYKYLKKVESIETNCIGDKSTIDTSQTTKDSSVVLVKRQEEFVRNRVREEILATAKIIKQCSEEIILTEEYIRQKPRSGDDLARANTTIATNTNRRFQQMTRLTEYAHQNSIWLDVQALEENRLVFESDSPDMSADGDDCVHVSEYLSVVKNEQPTEPQTELQKTEPIVELLPPINYAELSESLKNARRWEEIASLVGCSASTFAAAVRYWSQDQKQVLINHLVNYFEENSKAIFFHELDWMPIQSLQKALLSLSFKVRDITGGIGAAKWHNGCQFVSVSDYCKEEGEVWTFLKSDKNQIKAYGRDDFEIVGF